MKRRLLIIAICLLLGAVVNVTSKSPPASPTWAF